MSGRESIGEEELCKGGEVPRDTIQGGKGKTLIILSSKSSRKQISLSSNKNTDQVTLLSYTTLINLPAKMGCPKSGGVQQETDADVVGDYSANTSCEADPSSLGISEYIEGERVFAYHGPRIHDAKVLKVKMQKVTEEKRYFIHYLGWNRNWDDWVGAEHLLKFTEENKKLQEELKLKQQGTGKNPVCLADNVSATRKHEVHEAKKGASKDGRTKRRKSSIASLAALSTPSSTNQGVPLVSNELGSTAQSSGQSRRTVMFEQLVERDSLIGCGGYVLVYDFWVPPEHEAMYTEIVKNQGHIPILLKEIETKVNARRAQLPSVIAKLRRNLVLLRVEAQAHAATQERLVAEVATKANVTNAAIVTNEKLLREAEEELAATQ
ncbi:hypothetical protein C5167_035986 [Papaver somniferum]|nr:hypothetical protein C5167_035986 [Papaver somniferum]